MIPAIQPFKTAFELAPLMNALLREKKDKTKYAAGCSLKNLWHALTGVYDLLFAAEAMEWLIVRNESEHERAPAAVLGSVLYQAILSYVKATEDGLKRVNVLPALTDEQKQLHARLVDIRHNVIAHFGKETISGAENLMIRSLF